MRLPIVTPLLPARVIAQALDDLHAIAEAARRLPTIEAMLTEQFEVLNRQADRIIDLGERIIGEGERFTELGERILDRGERIAGQGERIADLGEQILERGDRIADLGEKLHERSGALLEHSDRLHSRSDEVLEESERVRAAAHEVAVRGAEVAAALPALQQIVTTTEPLQGAIERFGRMVDRLPGGDRKRDDT